VTVATLHRVLAAIRVTTGCSVSPQDGKSEWFQLIAPQGDVACFALLRTRWDFIVPRFEQPSFALILCRGGPESGLFLHHLSNPWLREEYLAGCHDIPSWR
jgi:hypothetical protein